MRSFAQELKKLDRPPSSSRVRRNTATPVREEREHPILRLQRAVDDRAAGQLGQATVEEGAAGWIAAPSPRLGHDFSRISIHPPSAGTIQTRLEINRQGDEYEQEADRVAERVMNMTSLPVGRASTHAKHQAEQSETENGKAQNKRVQGGDTIGIEAPPLVRQVLAAPGQPLDAGTRALMESGLGYDLSRVRIHADSAAARSAAALAARAYALGSRVVFAQGQFQPGTSEGRRLLAHELAHVAQQSNGAAGIQRSPAPVGREEGDWRCGDAECKQQTTNNVFPTWAGDFIMDKHCLLQAEDGSDNGVSLTLRFKPKEHVDAEKIAFVQTAQSKSGGKPISIYEDKSEKEKEAAARRMIPEGKPGEGTHLDVRPAERTPLTGMRDVSGKSGLGDFELSTPPALSKPGKHFHDSSGNLQEEDAVMHDCPTLARTGAVAQQQILETAALAVAGAQTGIFYGSVQWGWKMGPKDKEATGLPIQVVSKDAPSSVFKQATELWNKSLTSEGKAVIPLPESMYIVSTGADLWDDPGKHKKVGRLAKGIKIGVTEKSDPKQPDWQNVVVVSGPLTGKTGWVLKTDIKQYPGPALPAP